MYTIGIDIGATKTIFVLLRGQRALKTKKILTPKKKEGLIRALKTNINELSENGSSTIKGIGLGVPGPLNQRGDLILNPPNLKCLRYTSLAAIIQKETGIKTKMENDANCFTLGEAMVGAGKSAKVVFGTTLGTGVGSGIVINGKLYRGAFGSAGELGHTTIKFDEPKCPSCGIPGCFEGYWGSESFFKRRGCLPQKLRERAEKDDKKAQNLFNEYGKYLGIGLANVINILDPEVIVIGGGIANTYKFFIQETKREVQKRVISPIAKKYVKIKKAALGELGGAIGAALLNHD